MYNGPVIDAELYTPWLGKDVLECPRADRSDPNDDPRLKRVASTFHHTRDEMVKPVPRTDDDILAQMDAGGVERAVLAAKVYSSSTDESVDAIHAELARIAAIAPERFRTIGTINPPQLGGSSYWDVMHSVRFLERAYEAHQVSGLHITPAPWNMPANHKWFYPLYSKCIELNICLYVYVGMPGPLWPMEVNNPLHLDEVALAFPDLKIVGHHIGDPWSDIAVRLAARHPNYYICTSAWNPTVYPAQLIEFLRGKWHGTQGCDKIIFASDWPLLDMQKTVASARRLDVSDERMRKFMYENAANLLWGN